MIPLCFQGKPFNITVIQVYALTTNAKEAEVERFYEDLKDLDETQAGIKIAGRNISNLRYADNTTLMAEREEELKSLLMNVKEESEKVLKSRIQLTDFTFTLSPQLGRLSALVFAIDCFLEFSKTCDHIFF